MLRFIVWLIYCMATIHL